MALRIAVMGTGGVRGYFGIRSALGGCDVTFIARRAQLAASRQRGLCALSLAAGVAAHVFRVLHDVVVLHANGRPSG
jgi:2-dehydropantoate 2-reductase